MLGPAFDPARTVYTLSLPGDLGTVAVTATAADPAASVQINDGPATAGGAAAPVRLVGPVALIPVVVRAPGGQTRSYGIAVTRPPSHYLKAGNTDAKDQFGYSVALAGDTLAVGAPNESSSATGLNGSPADNSAASSGAVYVFRLTGGTWAQEAYVKASNTRAGTEFGYSVALAGDTLAVGSPFERSNATGVNGNQADTSAPLSGAAYVFVRSGTTWTQQAYVKASNTRGGSQFGYSVALAGDTLAVGSLAERSNATGINGNQADTSALQSGAVYVFVRSGATWTQQAYVKASNTHPDDNFGFAVALAGDTLAVGAPSESGIATGINGDQNAQSLVATSGAVYVFVRSGTTWTQQAYVKASNNNYLFNFGTAVALSGDTLAIGAPGESGYATGINGDQNDQIAVSSGAVYVLFRSGATWTQQAYVKASNPNPLDQFGASVSLSGDSLAVGALSEGSAATGIDGDQGNGVYLSGAAYVFVRSGTTWTQRAYVKAGNTDPGDQFGTAVSLSGDTLAVGARFEDSRATGIDGKQADNGANDSGAVYVF